MSMETHPDVEKTSHITDRDQPHMVFEIVRSLGGSRTAAARLGRLAFPGRTPIDTPNLLASTSRGCIPHLTPDNVQKHTALGGGLFALEDFLGRNPADAAIHGIPPTAARTTPLHSFSALPSSLPVIITPRRCPTVATSAGNAADHITICTSTGFHSLTVPTYISSLKSLRPDVFVPLADVTGLSTAQAKRLLRSAERTEEWVGKLLDGFEELGGSAIFAPLLPVQYPLQWEYLTYLAEEDVVGRLSGLALYDVRVMGDLSNHQSLQKLPRLSLDPPTSPRQILRQVSLGVDIMPASFLNAASDAGVSVSFAFPVRDMASPSAASKLPLGIDMWLAEHQKSLAPLADGCTCYTCTKHHRAFVHHLLQAKEMLGWTLLQIHNHHVASNFFSAIRSVLAEDDTGERFAQECKAFDILYEPELPEGTGTRPRVRGYEFKSEAGQAKLNKAHWSKPSDYSTARDASQVESAAGEQMSSQSLDSIP